MRIVEKYFVYKGIKLCYFVTGKGKPLLFLPGGLRVSTYLQNIKYLSKHYQVYALDLPGFGKSSVPKDVWSLEDYSRLISNFIQYIGLKKVSVVGHSYGGGIGLYLAMHNKHVSRLMVFSPMGVESKQSRIAFYFNVLVTKSINDFLIIKNNRLRSIIFKNAISTVTKNVLGVKKMVQIVNKVMYRHTWPEALAKISVPVKLLWGNKDELLPSQNGRYLQKHIPKSTLEILQGNHDWLTVNPKKSTEKIVSFIS